MRKEELRKLRALPATKEMMEKGKRYQEKEERYWYSGTKHLVIYPEYDLLLRVQNLQGYIKIALFLPEKMRQNIKTPVYEIFLNVQGNEYITRELDDEGKEVRWLTAMVHNLDGVKFNCWYKNSKVFISKDGMNTLNRLKLDKDRNVKGITRLQYWQQEQKNKETERKEAREQAPWDADMKLVPKIPNSFEEWMRRDAASEYYMIYEYSSKGQKIGYCSKCKKYVPIAKPLHGKTTTCPSCKAKTIFKAHSRLQTLGTPSYEAEIIQKFKGGIVIRAFEQHQWYRGAKYTEPHIRTHEFERIMIFDDGTVKKYEWGNYKQKFHRWIQNKEYFPARRTYYSSIKRKLFKRNLSQLKQYSLLKHSAIDLWPELPLPTTNYIEMEKGNPLIEKLARIGMFKLAKEIIFAPYDSNLLNEEETELAKMLKLDGSRLKRLKEMDGNLCSLKWMQYEKMVNKIWPDKMIKDFGEARMQTTSSLGFLNTPISFVKCHNYLKKQAASMEESIAQVLVTWRDYINMAEQLKMNTKLDQIQRPKDLKLAHDELVLIMESKGLEKTAKKLEKQFPKVNSQLPKLKKFEFTLGEFTIVAPKNVLDIVTEGTILKHCIHTCDYYFSRIQKDESYLFFLRRTKQPDMPWYTLEVEPSGNIRQKRTTGDNQNTDLKKAEPFLRKWQKFFKQQLTEEEKELGEISDKLRKENYKKIREQGKKVWHGKLAGKLLADVLEADFMEAI